MNMYKSIVLFSVILMSSNGMAALNKYIVDVRHKHAYIQFKVSHLGYSYVLGQFDQFKGVFCYDPDNPSASRVEIELDINSLDTGHAERDKHVRGEDYLDASKFPTAKFVSTSFEETGNEVAKLTGDLSLHGVTRTITMEVIRVGMGDDPWRGYRAGFEARFNIIAADYDLNYSLGVVSQEIEIYVILEGIRSKYANIECPVKE